jgi:hypothetical protein
MSPHICTHVFTRTHAAAYSNGRIDNLYVALLGQYFACFCAQGLHFGFGDQFASFQFFYLSANEDIV